MVGVTIWIYVMVEIKQHVYSAAKDGHDNENAKSLPGYPGFYNVEDVQNNFPSSSDTNWMSNNINGKFSIIEGMDEILTPVATRPKNSAAAALQSEGTKTAAAHYMWYVGLRWIFDSQPPKQNKKKFFSQASSTRLSRRSTFVNWNSSARRIAKGDWWRFVLWARLSSEQTESKLYKIE